MTLAIKSEGDKQIAYGEVYAPNRPDAHGEYMTGPEIEAMAHRFARSGKMDQIDVNHDNKVVKGCHVVESFIARDNDPDFLPGAWVVGVHVPDKDLWNKLKTGELNGFSMEALVSKEDKHVELHMPPIITGRTTKSEDHHHEFFAKYNDDGKFLGGYTNVVDGHSHQIIAGTHTETANGHRHRFSSVDQLKIVE